MGTVPQSSCTFDSCPISSSPYGYRPNQGASIVFLVNFASSFIGLLIITVYTKQWLVFSIPLSIVCVLETIGYAIRIGSYHNPWDIHLYAATEFLLTIAPSFVSSSIYLITERLLALLGREHSGINPRWYRYLIVVDIICFAVQVIGLGAAMWDITARDTVGPDSDKGARIIAGGIGLHALVLTIFLILYSLALVQSMLAYREYGYTTFNAERGGFQKLSWKFKLFLVALLVGILCLLTRDVYRIIGFAKRFDGGTETEGWFALFDGLMISEAVLSFVVLHPSYVFTDYSREKDADKFKTTRSVSYGKLTRLAVV